MSGYDVNAVVRRAAERHPGVDPDELTRLAVAAEAHVVDMSDLDAPELARRLLLDTDEPVDASTANAVAVAAVEHLSGDL